MASVETIYLRIHETENRRIFVRYDLGLKEDSDNGSMSGDSPYASDNEGQIPADQYGFIPSDRAPLSTSPVAFLPLEGQASQERDVYHSRVGMEYKKVLKFKYGKHKHRNWPQGPFNTAEPSYYDVDLGSHVQPSAEERLAAVGLRKDEELVDEEEGENICESIGKGLAGACDWISATILSCTYLQLAENDLETGWEVAVIQPLIPPMMEYDRRR